MQLMLVDTCIHSKLELDLEHYIAGYNLLFILSIKLLTFTLFVLLCDLFSNYILCTQTTQAQETLLLLYLLFPQSGVLTMGLYRGA